MVEEARSILINTRDALRTAPFGEAIALSGLTAAILGHEHPPVIIMGAVSVILGLRFVRTSLALRDRLEESIEKFGYRDDFFVYTTREWCTRQIARVATERHGVLADYEALCREQVDRQLRYLPHI